MTAYRALTTRDHDLLGEHDHPLARTIRLRETRRDRHASRVRAVVATIIDTCLLEVEGDAQREAVQTWVERGYPAGLDILHGLGHYIGHEQAIRAADAWRPAFGLTDEQVDAQIAAEQAELRRLALAIQADSAGDFSAR